VRVETMVDSKSCSEVSTGMEMFGRVELERYGEGVYDSVAFRR
jgi:hypothetical protein